MISYSEVSSTGYLNSLAINMFVCSVISCSKVSSTGYLVGSDDALVCNVISYSEMKRVVLILVCEVKAQDT